jgi:HPt (histidine-containing phosphotransfer) domain-containing protein
MSRHPTAAAPSGPDLPDLPGVDLNAALVLMDGSHALLLRAVRAFAGDYAGVPDAILAGWRERRYADVGHLAHNMKGAASYLCASELSASAAALEYAAGAANADAVGALAPLFVGQMNSVLDGLAQFIAAQQAAAQPRLPFDAQRRAQALALVERAVPLVRAGNHAAAELLEQLEAALQGGAQMGRTVAIRELFDDLDTDAAADLLAGLGHELEGAAG